MTADNRSDWKWLEGTYWYCAADSMPAIQGQGTHSFGWVIDQTVWSITGYRDGYFWGVASVLLTKAGETPDPAGKKDMTFLASITPEGQVYIAFIRSAVASTVGTGRVTSSTLSDLHLKRGAVGSTRVQKHAGEISVVRQVTPSTPPKGLSLFLSGLSETNQSRLGVRASLRADCAVFES